jgi:predicted Zn-dependent protease
MQASPRLYRTEGDVAMARRHYERALEQSRAFQIPDEEYALRIELAEMYFQTGATEDYRNALQRVINRDPVFARDRRLPAARSDA